LKLVHRNQYGFIKGETIQDCLPWSFEYLHQCKTPGREIVVIKLDFTKAFDTIEHSSILQILRHMGFDDRWLSWIFYLEKRKAPASASIDAYGFYLILFKKNLSRVYISQHSKPPLNT
jgi:hypothetical protein